MERLLVSMHAAPRSRVRVHTRGKGQPSIEEASTRHRAAAMSEASLTDRILAPSGEKATEIIALSLVVSARMLTSIAIILRTREKKRRA